MRIVKEYIRPECKVTVFHWNQKYLIKLEQDDLEQTYKIDELDLTGEQDIEAFLSEEFYKDVKRLFVQMAGVFSSHTSLF